MPKTSPTPFVIITIVGEANGVNAPVTVAVALADKWISFVTLFLRGLEQTGSKIRLPFGERHRAAQNLVR